MKHERYSKQARLRAICVGRNNDHDYGGDFYSKLYFRRSSNQSFCILYNHHDNIYWDRNLLQKTKGETLNSLLKSNKLHQQSHGCNQKYSDFFESRLLWVNVDTNFIFFLKKQKFLPYFISFSPKNLEHKHLLKRYCNKKPENLNAFRVFNVYLF